MLNKHLLKFKAIVFCCVLLSGSHIYAQEKEKSVFIPECSGYVKLMEIIPYTPDAGSNPLTTLLHNRLNFKWYLSNNITASLEVRNQLYFGDAIKMQQPAFGNTLEMDGGWVDLSFVSVDENSVVLHTIIDRAWVEYVKGKWNIKAGRQRINWGINSAWNPNDIFNSYNFLDFDYEERPGSDALKITNFLSDLSFIEVAIKVDDNLEDMVIASKYQVNKKGYDVQFLGGKFLTDVVLGTGWAGNIKDAGFKGELTYFHPYDDFANSHGEYSFSTSLDYSFENGWFVGGSYLFNSSANDKLFFLAAAGVLEQSAKNLYPAMHTYSASVGKQINPLLTGNFTVLYSPNKKALILLPAFTFSVAENFDFDFIVQSFFGEFPVDFENITNGFYTRLKYSF